jgi:hypothetical protein
MQEIRRERALGGDVHGERDPYVAGWDEGQHEEETGRRIRGGETRCRNTVQFARRMRLC